MPVLITVVYIGSTMVIDVLTRSFDAVVVALTLNVAELLRWNVPAAWRLPVCLRRWAVWLS